MRLRTTVLLALLSGVTIAAAPPPADRPVQLTPGDGTVHLAWEDTGAPVYDIVRDGVVVATTTAQEFTDAVTDGLPHDYEVRVGDLSIDPLGALTAVAGDTTVAQSAVVVRIVRTYADGAVLHVHLPDGADDVVAVQVHAGGELLGRQVVVGGTAVVDVWGLTPALLDSLELLLEDVVGNTTVAVYEDGRGPGVLLSLERLRDLPLPPVDVRAEVCRDGTTVTWSTLGSHSGRWAVRYGDGRGWATVDEPRATIPADVTTFQLATWSGSRLSEWSPPIANEAAAGVVGGLPTCAVTVTEPSRVDGVAVDAEARPGSSFVDVWAAGATARIRVDGSGVVGARVTGGELQSPVLVGTSNGGSTIHVPLRHAEVGTDGTLRAELLGTDGTPVATVDVPVPAPTVLAPAHGGAPTVELAGDTARVTAPATPHDREVLRDGVVVGHLPAGASTVEVAGHDVGHVHTYQLRGIGDLPLTSRPLVVTR